MNSMIVLTSSFPRKKIENSVNSLISLLTAGIISILVESVNIRVVKVK